MNRCRIIGKYVNAVGQPVRAAKIVIRPAGGGVTATAVTASTEVKLETRHDGVFVANLFAGEYVFEFPDKQTYKISVPAHVGRARFEELVNHG